MVHDIFTVVNTHFNKFRENAFHSIQQWIKTDAGKAENKLSKLNTNSDIAKLLEDKYDLYIDSMYRAVDMVKSLLSKRDIFFRMYDIHMIEESPGTIICKWIISGYEYVCVINANIDQDPSIQVSYTHGDLVMDSVTINYADSRLPDWFVSGLKHSFC